MSSLAGALTAPQYSSSNGYDDFDMQATDDAVEDLFGEEEEAQSEGQRSDRLATPERERRREMEYEEDDTPADFPVEVKEANVAFPNLPTPKSSDSGSWVLRLPNFVKLDSKPFHPDTYMGPEHEEEPQLSSVRERSMSVKLQVENTMRWRWAGDGASNNIRQANSRVIRWSDGTMSLRLGKELFDIHQSVDTSGAAPRQLGASQSSQTSVKATKSQGLTYLVAQHKRSFVLQAEAAITGYMSLRPAGMQSETHRMLVRAVGQKHNKISRLMMAPDPVVDPEREKMEMLKQDAKKAKRRNHESGGRSRSRRGRIAQDYSDDEDEDMFGGGSEEEGETHRRLGNSGKKRKSAQDDDGREDYREDGFVVADDSDEEDGTGKKRKIDTMDELDRLDAQLDKRDSKRKRSNSDSSDEDANGDDGMDIESEEEDDVKQRRSGETSARRKRAVFDEDEED